MTFATLISFVFSLASFFSVGPFLVNGSHVVYTTQAFYLPISRSSFDFGEEDLVEYRASLLNMPDLPKWMHYRHPNGSDQAFLYGAPEEPGDVNIEIIALNKRTYETSRHIINFQVQHRGREAKFQAEMKLLNLNVEDLFEGSRLRQIEDIFKDHLWKKSESVYVTMVASAVDVGGRKPLNPRDKEGVVVRVGATDNFTQDLLDLEREVMPLRKRYPCPKDYIRTAAEHLFRRRDFLSDWCSFRLISYYRGKLNDGRKLDGSSTTILLREEEKFKFHLPTSRIPRRDFLQDFIVSIVVPLVLVLVLLTGLSCAFCCHSVRPVQLSTYNSIQRGTGGTVAQLRTSVSNRSEERRPPAAEISLPQACTPSPIGGSSNSLTARSRTGSPSSTLPKTTTSGYESRSSTLRPGGLPPPPPYLRANSRGDRLNLSQ